MLKEKIEADIKTALLAGDKITLSVLRMMLAEVKNELIKKGSDLSDNEIVNILSKQVKVRRQAITEFERADRFDLADQERSEIKVIQLYLPEALSDKALSNIINEVVNDTKASSIKDMGKVMSGVMSKAQGKAEGQKVSALVKQKLESL